MLLILTHFLSPAPVLAEPLRLAVFHTDLGRDGPGLLYRDILRGEDEQITAVIQIINETAPDILLLLDFDYDADGAALAAFANLLADALPHQLALRPNAGWPTGVDVDGDGRLGEPEDAHGYGRFSGSGGMALLSRYPIGVVTDHSALLWRDLPGGRAAQVLSPAALDVLRLPTMGLWQVRLETPTQPLTVFTLHAGPPVFDGPEDRNGLRNEDEIDHLLHVLDGHTSALAVMGTLNVDPNRGEGRRGALRTLLDHPALQDPVPLAPDGTAATTNWNEPTPGRLRVDYILPAAGAEVMATGIIGTADEPRANTASGHRLVWMDLRLPEDRGE